jgi:hypothetical protein
MRPIRFHRAIRPEWVDFALAKYVSTEDQEKFRLDLKDHLRQEVDKEATVDKAARQLSRVVGFKSRLSREALKEAYEDMRTLSPDERTCLRVGLIIRGNEFARTCAQVITRFVRVGAPDFETSDLYTRMKRRYGDRSAVERSIRYVLETLKYHDTIKRKGQKKWIVLRSDCLNQTNHLSKK